MDQLYNNDTPAFTTWVIENDLLEEPFVVIEVGVQGGPHPCWKHLKDKVRVYGFDAIPEVVEALNAQKQPNEVYFATALGEEEGTRDFYVRSEGGSYYGSSFYELPSDLGGRGVLQPGSLRKVPITRLDTLFAKGIIPLADHIKVDCDGHDPEVIRGAQRYLAQSNVVSIIVETAFTVSQHYPRSHFVAISDILRPTDSGYSTSLSCARLGPVMSPPRPGIRGPLRTRLKMFLICVWEHLEPSMRCSAVISFLNRSHQGILPRCQAR
jgi:FkbM family methyltransferase